MRKKRFLLPVAAVLPMTALTWFAPVAAEPGRVTAIVGATVFDGTGAAPHAATVLIRDGRIIAVGDVKAPRGAIVIRAGGKALLPGLFDVHTHWTPSGRPDATPQIATAYVRSGVTTVNDFHQQPESYAPRREWLSTLTAPHVNFAARISTPGGHGADWGDQNTTIWISTPETARAAIERLKPYKPDLIKAFADGWRYGNSPDNTSMNEDALRALRDAAHAQGLPLVTHTVTVDRGAVAARAGVDALAHGLQDRPIDAATLKTIVDAKMAMAPTLAVYEPDKDGAKGDPADPRYRQSLRKFGYALANVKTMFDAGVPIALGTDAGMPGTLHGDATLRELELLVRAGLKPAQALVVGTSVSAKLMRLDGDRGTIQPGKRADILLVDGKPWEIISDIRRVDRVLIDGKLVVGRGAPQLPAGNQALRLPSAPVASLIDDFERPDGRTSLDTLRLETNDGGMDRTVEITQIVPRGAGHALEIAARMATKANAYAGVAFPLHRGSVRPADLRKFTGLRLSLQSKGHYVIRLTGADGTWSTTIEGERDWKVFEVPFASLEPATSLRRSSYAWTGDAIYQIEIGASRAPSTKVSFQIDDLNFF